ncbi:MAG: serine/threonine protein kinase, partial [Candidatus Obscuribacterales bacterium]|nr:serine/threonine protein kinase [Candidatus Obscuribacterales bacterium]
VMARFEREARIVSNLEHPNIITVHDFGFTEKKQPYMVMEFIDGQDLDTALKAQPDGLPLEQALPILSAASAGLAYAHEQGILHRDIKPSNIALKQLENGELIPKLLDFGLAKLTGWNAGKEVALTQEQQILGSPVYMSPELVLGKTTDARSDIYSFACMIFEVVTGYTPFVGETAVEVATKRLTDPPLTFAEVQANKKYPEELEQLINRALERDPDKRFQTMKELHDQLSKINPKAPEKTSKNQNSSIWSQLRKFNPFSS